MTVPKIWYVIRDRLTHVVLFMRSVETHKNTGQLHKKHDGTGDMYTM